MATKVQQRTLERLEKRYAPKSAPTRRHADDMMQIKALYEAGVIDRDAAEDLQREATNAKDEAYRIARERTKAAKDKADAARRKTLTPIGHALYPNRKRVNVGATAGRLADETAHIMKAIMGLLGIVFLFAVLNCF